VDSLEIISDAMPGGFEFIAGHISEGLINFLPLCICLTKRTTFIPFLSRT